MKKTLLRILAAVMVALMIFSFSACMEEEVAEVENTGINRSDIPKSDDDIVDYYNNVVLALLKETDGVKVAVVTKEGEDNKTYVEFKDLECFEGSMADNAIKDAANKAAKDAGATEDVEKKDKNDALKAAIKGVFNLIIDNREERTDADGLPVTGTVIPAEITLDDLADLKSNMGDDTSNKNNVLTGSFYTLNFFLNEYKDPTSASTLAKFIDMPDLDGFMEEFAKSAEYIKINDYSITYKDSSFSVDVTKENDQVAYINYTIIAYVTAEVEGVGPMADSGVNTVEFKVQRFARFKFEWPEAVAQ